MNRARPLGDYGVDAPWVSWMLVGFGVIYLVLSGCAFWLWNSPWFGIIIGVVGILMLVGAWLFWHTTRRGKFTVWREVLGEIPAAARVLDMGCGRGAVSIMAAQQFPRAQVTGLDLWRSVDQSGNSPEAAESNARLNDVADRITFLTGDMTQLPSPDASADLVTASLSIHNVPSAAGRMKAVDEAWRVLVPGGRLVVVDISKVGEYQRRLRELGAADLRRRPVGWRMWWSGPWMATDILEATKPLA
ncbi:class I SAM-dependent methyltransferase [Microbacterium horticulturae]|uniref:Class I SAM-dependent methyltransferase n=1 Tax=Microbacterium horticulturae TaxID=3028316 RepID=A0ABY8C260_9MICO|nr:class I SAM-dependent methyltransferase [Microbacterium sp. KACC 23027]WEG10551.1 class I SAM-dependent methyltransferase [Microbacterium sp. KACC 23027]